MTTMNTSIKAMLAILRNRDKSDTKSALEKLKKMAEASRLPEPPKEYRIYAFWGELVKMNLQLENIAVVEAIPNIETTITQMNTFAEELKSIKLSEEETFDLFLKYSHNELSVISGVYLDSMRNVLRMTSEHMASGLTIEEAIQKTLSYDRSFRNIKDLSNSPKYVTPLLSKEAKVQLYMHALLNKRLLVDSYNGEHAEDSKIRSIATFIVNKPDQAKDSYQLVRTLRTKGFSFTECNEALTLKATLSEKLETDVSDTDILAKIEKAKKVSNQLDFNKLLTDAINNAPVSDPVLASIVPGNTNKTIASVTFAAHPAKFFTNARISSPAQHQVTITPLHPTASAWNWNSTVLLGTTAAALAVLYLVIVKPLTSRCGLFGKSKIEDDSEENKGLISGTFKALPSTRNSSGSSKKFNTM